MIKILIYFTLLLIITNSTITAQCTISNLSFQFNPKTDLYINIYTSVTGKFTISQYGTDPDYNILINAATTWEVTGQVQLTSIFDSTNSNIQNKTSLTIIPKGKIIIPDQTAQSTIIGTYGQVKVLGILVASCYGTIQLIPTNSTVIPSPTPNPNNPINPINPFSKPKTLPVFRYRTSLNAEQKFYYSLNPKYAKYGNGWIYYGIAFYVPQQKTNQASPVNQYYISQPQSYGEYKFYFGVDLATVASFCNWKYITTAFYAYNFPKNGTIPVYKYYIKQNDGYKYQYDISQKPIKQGWKRGEVAFWAYNSQ